MWSSDEGIGRKKGGSAEESNGLLEIPWLRTIGQGSFSRKDPAGQEKKRGAAVSKAECST